MFDLEKLREKREEILKAELAAWLHDVGKLSEEFIEEHSKEQGKGDKWHHELVLRRILRRIEKKFNKSWQNITKDEVLKWMVEEFSVNIPSEKRGRPFPNPHRREFPNKLDSYLSRDLATGNEIVRRKLVEVAKQISYEARINSQFFVESFYEFCENAKITIYDETISIADIIEQHGDPIEAQSKLVKLFKPPSCDGIDSSMDKGFAESIQKDRTFISKAFGHEKFFLRHLNCLRKILSSKFNFAPQNYYLYRKNIKSILKRIFSRALGETRRGANDVTLWDHSYSVGALYKSLIAWIVLRRSEVPEVTEFLDSGGQWKGNLWRLLSIRTDGLSYFLSASSIPDMLARKEILQDAWNKVQKVLEEDYPLGLEVYRDENGPVFVVPDLDVLGLTNSSENNKTLREYILEAFQSGTVRDDPCLAINGEIVPVFYLDEDPWDGQSKLPPIGEHLKKIPTLQSDPKWVAGQWCNLPKEAERCTVCGLRPQGPSEKARERKVCDICEKRGEDRAKEWAVNIGRVFVSTIWIDEVADKNGRIALITGKFDLQHWLSGDLVRSLAVREPNDKNGHHWKDISKNPSFARLRRIWETTRKFWEDVKDEILPDKVDERDKRIFIKGQLSNELGPYHAYEIEIKGQRVAVLWDDEREGLWIIENPEYFKERLGIDFEEELTKVKSIEIYEPSEYGKQRKPAATMSEFKIERPPDSGYIPLIPILAEPQVFMAIVPANKAFELVKAIKTKYEREMGKVRNRLPLHIGVVYAYRKMPLRAIMDAGRRMLKQKCKPDNWQVLNIKTFGQPNNPNERKGWRALHLLKRKDLIEEHPDQFRVVHCVLLKKKDEKFESRLIWYVPAVMGDGQTEDHWYPYVFWQQDKDGNTDPANANRKINRYYKAPNPFNPYQNGKPQENWLVHAGELEPGDKIYFTPATFDFEFLDTNARRFEITYDKNGKRRNSLTKPYLLDEVEILDKIWKFLTQKQNGKPRLSTTQIFALREIIETKREEWFDEPHNSLADENFKKFCHDLFVNAQWQWGKPGENELKWLAEMAVRGYFTDAVYLFNHVMKEKIDDHTETR